MQTTTRIDWSNYRFAVVSQETGKSGLPLFIGHDDFSCPKLAGERVSPAEVEGEPWPCSCVQLVPTTSDLLSLVSKAQQEAAAPEFRAPGARLDGKVYSEADKSVKPAARGRVTPPTDKQTSFINKLLAERQGNRDAECIATHVHDYTQDGLFSKTLASKAISNLLAIPANAPAAPAEREVPAANMAPRKRVSFPNRFPKKCALCGVRVGEGEGLFEVNDEGDKHVVHRDGKCPSAVDVPVGRYAFEVDGVMKFYRVTPEGIFAQASDDLHRLTNQVTIDSVVAAIQDEGIKACMRRHGIELGACGRCGRSLTSEWRLQGIGPVCADKGF